MNTFYAIFANWEILLKVIEIRLQPYNLKYTLFRFIPDSFYHENETKPDTKEGDENKLLCFDSTMPDGLSTNFVRSKDLAG